MATITFDEITIKIVPCNVARTFYHKYMFLGYKMNMYPSDEMMDEPKWNKYINYQIIKNDCGEYSTWSIIKEDDVLIIEEEDEEEEELEIDYGTFD